MTDLTKHLATPPEGLVESVLDGMLMVLYKTDAGWHLSSAFYDVNKGILEDCKRLMTPVLYAEEAEVIGIGSISPVALNLAARHIVQTLGERTGSTPIVSKLLLHHEGWLSLCQKQFEL